MPQAPQREVLTGGPAEGEATLAQLIKWIEPENTGIIAGSQLDTQTGGANDQGRNMCLVVARTSQEEPGEKGFSAGVRSMCVSSLFVLCRAVLYKTT